jgi:hypothetical protein
MDQLKINDRFSIDQLDWNKQDETSTIRAAEKSDPAFLKAILAYYATYGNDESLPDPKCHQRHFHQITRYREQFMVSGSLP